MRVLIDTDTVHRLDPLYRMHCKHQTIYPYALPKTVPYQEHDIRRQYCISDCDSVGCLRYSRGLLHLYPYREAVVSHARRWLHESVKVLLRSSSPQHRNGRNHPPDANAHRVETSHLQGPEAWSFWDFYSGSLVRLCCLYSEYSSNITQDSNIRYHSSGRPDPAFHPG